MVAKTKKKSTSAKGMFRVRKGMSLVNENGDVWRVDKVHRDGFVTILYGGGGGDDTVTYTDGEIASWFRPLPKGEDDSADYVDPKRIWGKR